MGCGDMPYKEYIDNLVDQYDTIDFEEHVSDIKYIGDIQNMARLLEVIIIGIMVTFQQVSILSMILIIWITM